MDLHPDWFSALVPFPGDHPLSPFLGTEMQPLPRGPGELKGGPSRGHLVTWDMDVGDQVLSFLAI